MAKSHLLIANTNDGERDRTSTYTAGDVIGAYPPDFVFGIREDVEQWVRAGNKRDEFPKGFIILDLDIPYAKAQLLHTANFFPMRVSNYNLDFTRLPAKARGAMRVDVVAKRMQSGRTRHKITAKQLDACLLPRFGNKKPSDF